VASPNRTGQPLYSAGQMTYFQDPAVDRVMQVTLALMAEVWVLRDRVRALEEQLEANGSVNRSALDQPPSDPDIRAARARERDEFVASVLGTLLPS